MSDLVRMSITMERELYDRLEEALKAGPAASRSEFIRDLVRERLSRDAWKNNEEAVGTITVVYDHEVRELTQKLTHLQHHHHEAILATTHVHLTEEVCVEMIMVRGRASEIEALAEGMRAHKGVLHAAVSVGSTGKRLASLRRRPHRHPHPH